MSRVFNENSDEYLLAQPPAETETQQNYVRFAWIKPVFGTSSSAVHYIVAQGAEFGTTDVATGLGVRGRNSGESSVRHITRASNYTAATNHEENQWHFLCERVIQFEGGSILESYFNGVLVETIQEEFQSMVLQGNGQITAIGRALSVSNFIGKIAHVGIIHEAIDPSVIVDLANGMDPALINSSEKFAYYPLVDNSLINVWGGTNSLSDLSEGTTAVTVDELDNPTIGIVTPSPLISVTQPTTYNGSVDGTYTNFTGIPAASNSVNISDATRSITVPVTVTDNGDGSGTFTGTMPTLPNSGSSVAANSLIYPGSATLTFTDPGEA